MPVEIVSAEPEAVARFLARTEREALKTLYDFNVVWHEQRHDLAAVDDGITLGVVSLRIAASIAQLETLVVLAERRRQGIGRDLLARAAEIASYYNCHKLSVFVPHRSAAQKFFEKCGYKEEAVLPQHTFKLDVAVLRKFLL